MIQTVLYIASMSNRIFLSRALLCFAAAFAAAATATATSPLSRESYGQSIPRDLELRPIKRCSSCPPDRSDVLASPRYDVPLVYGRPVGLEDDQFEHQSAHRPSCSEARRLPRGSPNPYRNPFSRQSEGTSQCPHGGCSTRSPRSDEGVAPRMSRNNGNMKSGPFQSHSGGNIEPEEKEPTTYNHNPFREISTPSDKKFYVVYRADADPSMEDQEKSSRNSSSHQRTQNPSVSGTTRKISEAELEEIVRKSVAEVMGRKTGDEKLHSADQQRRRTYERDQEFYNPRPTYRDPFYPRFNQPTKRFISDVVPERVLDDTSEVTRGEYNNRDDEGTLEMEGSEEDAEIDTKATKEETSTPDEKTKNSKEDMATNYRIHSRKEQEDKEQSPEEGTEDSQQDDDSSKNTGTNPDVVEDMTKPPTEVSEIGLELAFSNPQNSTPLPKN